MLKFCINKYETICRSFGKHNDDSYSHNASKKTQSSTAVVLLRKKLAAGEVNLKDNPEKFWSSDPLFMEHKLDNFRSIFNRIRTEEQKKQVRQFKFPLFIQCQFSIQLY